MTRYFLFFNINGSEIERPWLSVFTSRFLIIILTLTLSLVYLINYHYRIVLTMMVHIALSPASFLF